MTSLTCSRTLHNVRISARTLGSSLILPKKLLELKEPVLDEHDQLAEVDRAPGINTFGMVA